MKKGLLVLAITLLFLGIGKFYAIDLGQYDTLFSKELEGNVVEVNEQDSGYMLLLETKSWNYSINMYDDDFNLKWQYTFGSSEYWDTNYVVDSDGNYIFLGSINEVFSVLTISKDGKIIAKKTYDDYSDFGECKLEKEEKDGYILSCEKTVGVNHFPAMIKLNKKFEFVGGIASYRSKIKIPNVAETYFDAVTKYIKIDNNNVAVCGYTTQGDDKSYECMKVTDDKETGNFKYTYFDNYPVLGYYKCKSSNKCYLYYENGNILIAESEYDYDVSTYNGYLGKFDLKANEIWSNYYPNNMITFTHNNSLMLNGNDDVYLYKIDDEGKTSKKIKLIYTYGYYLGEYDDEGDMILDNYLFCDGNYIIKYDSSTLQIKEKIKITETFEDGEHNFIYSNRSNVFALDDGYIFYNDDYVSYLSADNKVKIYYNFDQFNKNNFYVVYNENKYYGKQMLGLFQTLLVLDKNEAMNLIDVYIDMLKFQQSYQGSYDDLYNEPEMIEIMNKMYNEFYLDEYMDNYGLLLSGISKIEDLTIVKEKIPSIDFDFVNIYRMFLNCQKLINSKLYQIKNDAYLSLSYDSRTGKTTVSEIKKATYKIDFDSNYGKLKLNKNSAKMGDKIEFEIIPNNGYKLVSFKIVKKNHPELKIDVENNKFYMPNEDVTVIAEFEKTKETTTSKQEEAVKTTTSEELVDNPNTSDNVLTYFILGGVSLISIVLLLIINKKKNKKRS
jgi:hypothetical protein